jgi:glucose-1-phosphate thymidylyltransferase
VKGVVLAGGLGSRLKPLTKVTNKHLLPVYNQPMIYYPIQTLINAGIDDIMIVTGGNSAGDFLKLLGNGKDFGLKHLNYTYQEGEGGIADALSLVEHFADDEPICVVLGDNIIEGNVTQAAKDFRHQDAAQKFCSNRFTIRSVSAFPNSTANKSCKSKKNPPFRNRIMQSSEFISTTRPFSTLSKRSNLQNAANWNYGCEQSLYHRGEMTWAELDGWWTDAGTFESLLHATNLVAKTGANNAEVKSANANI